MSDPPKAPATWRDVVASLVVATSGAGVVRGVVRAHRWARRGRKVTRIMIVTGLFALAGALACVPVIGSRVLGRQATWAVLWHVAPVPTVALASCTGCLFVLAAVRTIALVRQ